MTFNRIMNSSASKWFIAFAIMGCFAFYQYSDGYHYAEDNQIAAENVCDNAFHHGRRSLSFFKVMGCKSQVADRRQKLEALFGVELKGSDQALYKSKMREQEIHQDAMMKLMEAEIKHKERRHFEQWVGNCQADPEACVEELTESQNMLEPDHAVQSDRPTLSAEECDAQDASGFLPEC